jgi:L-ascorbate metabolism protein UlaG (beta-lactamase superfamily)
LAGETKAVRWSRRGWIAGAGAAGVAGAGAFFYALAPGFWRYYFGEMKRPVAPPPLRPQPERWPDRGLHAAWLGHATVLLKIDGFTMLLDPIFSLRAGINVGPVTLGIKRLVQPALRLRELPRIDLILLSHAHMDHIDLPSLRRLERRYTTVVTASKTSDLVRAERYRSVHEVGWGGRLRVGGVTIAAFEVNHWGARMRTDHYRGYNGYLIEAGRHRVIFGGDTALTDSFARLRSSRPVDLAIMPIGTYNPWIRRHCTPEQAWKMTNDAGAEFILPIHHQTFPLGREPVEEPIERLYRAAGNHADRVALRRIGEEFHLS